MSHRFTFLIAYKNRDIRRVQNCLNSIIEQTIQNFEVIFVDYGSEENVRAEIEPLMKNYSFCHYIYTEARGLLWNKPNALNIGLKYAQGEYIIIADIDLIFCEDYLDSISKRIDKSTFLTHRCYYLPENYPLADLQIEPLSSHKENIPVNFIGLLAVDREAALKVNGFDNFYQIWGAEDEDFIARLEESGLKRRIVDVTEIPIYHQWHPMVSPKKPTAWYLAELNYLYLNPKSKMEGFSPLKPNNTVEVDFDPPDSYNLNIKDRPTLSVYLNGSYKNSHELKITGNNHLAFLEFYQGFSKLKSGEMCYLEYQNSQFMFDKGKMQSLVNVINKVLEKFQKFHYRLFREEKIRLSDAVGFKDVKEFIEYFLGVNRNSIEDYCYYPTETKLTLLIKKA